MSEIQDDELTPDQKWRRGFCLGDPMISALISLVVYLLIAGVIYWAVDTILGLIPMPAPIAQVIRVIMIVILVLIVVYALLGLIGTVPHMRLVP